MSKRKTMERHFDRVKTQTLTEVIDTRALDYILQVDESRLKRDGNEWLVSRSTLADIQKEAKKVFRDVKNGRLTVTYQRKVYCGEQFGREYAIGTSLQKLRRELREALSTRYVDIDAVNCQPTMLWDMLMSDREPRQPTATAEAESEESGQVVNMYTPLQDSQQRCCFP